MLVIAVCASLSWPLASPRAVLAASPGGFRFALEAYGVVAGGACVSGVIVGVITGLLGVSLFLFGLLFGIDGVVTGGLGVTLAGLGFALGIGGVVLGGDGCLLSGVRSVFCGFRICGVAVSICFGLFGFSLCCCGRLLWR